MAANGLSDCRRPNTPAASRSKNSEAARNGTSLASRLRFGFEVILHHGSMLGRNLAGPGRFPRGGIAQSLGTARGGTDGFFQRRRERRADNFVVRFVEETFGQNRFLELRSLL